MLISFWLCLFVKIFKDFTRKVSVGIVLNKVIVMQLYKKETPTQVFSCEISKFFNNIFFHIATPVAASKNC